MARCATRTLLGPRLPIFSVIADASCDPHPAMTRLLVTAAVFASALVAAETAPAKTPVLFKKCTALNKTYPHGDGRAGARNKTGREIR